MSAASPSPAVCVHCAEGGDESLAADIARRLGLPLRPAQQQEVAVWLDAQGPGLCMPGFKFPLRVVTPTEAGVRQRAQASLLCRACGPMQGDGRVIDGTAGLGRDGLVLARAGLPVLLLEAHPILALLLQLNLMQHDLVEVRLGDARDLLAMVAREKDVIYLDPMFSHERSGLPSRELQMLTLLVGGSDEVGLLRAALATPARRIVVKRARNAAVIDPAGVTPHHQLMSKLVRFDVYRS